MTQKHDINEHDDVLLEQMFATARASAVTPSPELMARIAADAQEVASARKTAPQTARNRQRDIAQAPRRHKISLWRQLFQEFGGLSAMGGFAASICLGVYLGSTTMGVQNFIAGSDATLAQDTAQFELIDDFDSDVLLDDVYAGEGL